MIGGINMLVDSDMVLDSAVIGFSIGSICDEMNLTNVHGDWLCEVLFYDVLG